MIFDKRWKTASFRFVCLLVGCFYARLVIKSFEIGDYLYGCLVALSALGFAVQVWFWLWKGSPTSHKLDGARSAPRVSDAENGE
jgi:hypothetical protein